MLLEQARGFRSSFNFIPEGDYQVTRELLEELVGNGFEIGIHDLAHDGHLFASAARFSRHARSINEYLRKWNACGFRAGFMLRNLDWYHQLDIEYDASTFDTDPFEPQPDGVGTIFPFWVPRNSSPVDQANNRSGYVELPYTLPQDSTLFLILKESDITIWRDKVDWIAQHGGMVLLNTHPDYMAMNKDAPDNKQFPVSWYLQLLDYISTRYAGKYWQALPREMARYYRDYERSVPHRPITTGVDRYRSCKKRKIWIDLDNTPHVPFFKPIIRELENRGFSVMLTARDAFQVWPLVQKMGLACFLIGRHHGKNKAGKLCGLIHRATQLASLVLRERPALAVSHGSRSQLMISRLLRVPSLLIDDYEHSCYPHLMKPDWMLTPEVIPSNVLPANQSHILRYPGIKEDTYASDFLADPRILDELGLTSKDIVITARPPATEAHYHEPESEVLFENFMNRACATPGVRVVILPRNNRQRQELQEENPHWFGDGCAVVPHSAVNGMNLLWHSDLVVGGGGTMNREAAVLGVPVYSLFRGELGSVDRHLSEAGRLRLITSVEDVAGIPFVRRRQMQVTDNASRRTLLSIVDSIEDVFSVCGRGS